MRLIFLLTVVAWSASPLKAQPLQGHVEQHSFIGPITNQPVNFNIYLPADYDAKGNFDHYPVIYHLHGIGGSQGGPQNNTVPQAFELAKAQGIIGGVIVVFPNGYTDSFWADALNVNKPADTDVIAQLVPHVDANFRTIKSPQARIMQGFSMGGFGATKFYTKYPDQFAACIEYDGAMVTWQVMLTSHPQQAQTIFNNEEKYFDQFSPWYWSSENVEVLQDKPPIRMVVGSLVGGNQNFRNHLQALQIPVQYVATGCGHDLGCLLNAQGIQSATFISASLGCAAWGGPVADVNHDLSVDVDDLLMVINAWGEQGANAADASGDGIVNADDLLAVINLWGACK